jgi:5-methyltetrahydrofolate--homocysteine methyltransferase
MADNPITEAAKELRRRQTEAEKRLWFKLRDNQVCGLKFRRQETIGNYIVDFVNFENKLVIEIDGSPHQKIETKRNDRQRTEWLKSEGFRVVRFWNSTVTNNLDGVVKKIIRETILHPHLRLPQETTSPIEGEE